MMNLLKFLIASISLQSAVAQAPEVVFCGTKPCFVPLAIPCRVMARDFNFQGSCCSLEDIAGTGGCRITIAGGGNCAWTPKCGECTGASSCNKIYETDSTEACKVTRYSVVPAPTNRPSVGPPSAMNRTKAPSLMAPTYFPSSPPTCPPVLVTSPPTKSSKKSSANIISLGFVTVALLSLITLYLGL